MLFDVNNIISLEDFKIKFNTVDEFKDIGLSISKGIKLPDYYLNYINSRDNCLYYTQYQEFLWAIGDSRFKFLEIEFDDKDKVCIFYKYVIFMNVRSIKVYDLPVSKNKNNQHIKEIINILISKDLYSTYIVDKERLQMAFNNFDDLQLERNYMSDNFYSTLEYMNKKLNSTFRSKYGINRLKEHLHYEFFNNHIDEQHKDLAIKIYEEWALHKENAGEFKQFKGMLNYSSPNINFLFTYYDEDPVGVSIFLNAGKYFIEEFCYTKVRTNFEDKQKKKALNKLVFYIKYLELNYIKDNYNIDTIYVLSSGDSSKNSGLYLNKKENNLDYIKYYILKKEDFNNASWR